ncbi:hypothetical protein A3742_02930 [Oleiphilus sp. HI0071]|uniref:HDOD domain-containing protein n=4 Tax=unclassified Oleiphilus TaxID=2631174 RepID=UPI0007C2E1F8|nr:HDOD domain-containing protein [Oleiphilus sp. HI0079]KZY61070.1 hypothetical protein A3737_06290 [Oleiphilus sp. HI0065]KZY89716.1 hypothetical protein A3744_06080 [Oleiphilus sp. HI0073]KZY90268.1 hypothetical protein A3742_02930 [Oleiphilus sp. HI0071]KZZ44093.1 hypothetical protein A3758_19180 [Oleiphilus sp. HI0118]KZZ55847.1 hypothetical protein A3760_00610 [Oleiphilus sp. HI0122]KZZ67999.1 hypothetical protein A3765_00600 [Oleiphilus sp. HI0130]KZZ80547.1 hypothetical protein A3767
MPELQSEKKQYPRDITQWLDYLLARKLPTALSLAPTCIKQMDEGSPSYLDLARILASDPVISLTLMRKANQNPRQTSVFSKTLDHAMSMLGHAQIREVLTKTPKLETKYGYRAYYQAQNISLTRASLAQTFAEAKGTQKGNDVFWGSLFADAAEWYLWCYATPLMRKIASCPQAHQKQEAEVQLGCDLNALQLEILKALNAPELAIQSKQSQHCLSSRDWAMMAKFGQANARPQAPLSGQDSAIELSPSLKIARQNPLFFIELSRFYLHYYLGNSEPKQISRALAVTSAGLNMPVDEVRSLTTQGLIKIARQYRLPFCTSAITQVFEDIREDYPENETTHHVTPQKRAITSVSSRQSIPKHGSIDVTSQKAKASESKTVFTPDKSFLELLRKMKESPASFSSGAELMGQLANQIQQGLKLERSAIYVLNKDKTRLKSYFTSGISEKDPLKGFETQIIKGTIFKVLSEKPAAVWLKPSSRKEVADLVPMNFKQTTQRDESLFASIFVRNKPVAILYADQAQNKAIDEAQFRYFKLATKALEAALAALRNKQSNHANP